MAENSKIEWTHHTFNPWRGCTKVSAGCANCYAETLSGRNPKTLGTWGPNGTRVVAAEAAWKEPMKWDRKAKEAGERHRVFCASLADVFEDWTGNMVDTQGRPLFITRDGGWTNEEDDVPVIEMHDVRRRLFALIDATPNLDWLLVTKRPENIARMMPAYFPGGYIPEAGRMNREGPRPNVWLGTSVENQAAANERIAHLLQTPAAVRFLSLEPLLGPVELLQRFEDGSFRNHLTGQFHNLPVKGQNGYPNFTVKTDDARLPKIDWCIVGGESGHGARPMNSSWPRLLREQCIASGTAFFFKQWGEWLPIDQAKYIPEFAQGFHFSIQQAKLDDDKLTARVGKKAAGRLLDGREWNDYPAQG